jgi:MoxR-like ATPase
MLLRAAKAHAMMAGRDHALPDDVQALAVPVLAHRLVLAPETPRGAARDVIHDALGAVRAL